MTVGRSMLAMAKLIVGCIAAGWLSLALADGAPALADRHAALAPRLAASAFHRPLVVESSESAGRMHGEIAAEIAFPYAAIVRHFTEPATWCEVVTLHINVKGCAARGDVLTVYSGRKFYQPLDRTYALRYAFRTAAARPDYLRIELAAETGPLGTSDYELSFEAMPAGERTFVVVRYGFRPSVASQLATASYLSTLGSGKPGFTIVGRHGDGTPEWIGGVRGIVERNAMRNFLALEAWLATHDAPAAERALRRLERMAALTDRYRAQLVEMPADDYVRMKQRERQENAVDRA